MTPSFPGRHPDKQSRMKLKPWPRPVEAEQHAPLPADSNIARRVSTFIIGNHTFYAAAKRALDSAGGFYIVGAFKMEDLENRLRRSTLMGQTPAVAIIHEPPGERAMADDAAHKVLQSYSGCGIVLVSGGELDAETERKLGVHDFKAIVVPDSAVKHPQTLAEALHSAIAEAGSPEQRVG